MPKVYRQSDSRQRRRAPIGPALLLACLASGCALQEPAATSRTTDIWDVALLPVRHIDLQVAALGNTAVDASGMISAIAGQGDRIFVTDPGSRRLLEYSLAAATLRTVASLHDGSSPGLLAGNDGFVYTLDPAAREVLVVDPFSGEQHRVSLAGNVARPVDLMIIDGRELAVLDGLDGRVVLLDVPGGIYRERPLRHPRDPVIASARAVAYAAGTILILDGRSDEVAGFDVAARPVGLYASGDLFGVQAMAADTCGRFFVSDGDDGTLYIGLPDMSVPGIRVPADDLAGKDVSDLWTDGVFLYVATRADGIFVYLVDPGCD